MSKAKITFSVLGSVAMLAMLTVVSPRSGEAQIGSTPVRVVNTPSTPVPVTGNVTAAVTGNVNAEVTGNVSAVVNGEVALSPGAVVNIGNPATNPVFVRVVDNVGEPTQGNASCNFVQTSCTVDVVTVPAGKRLVIEHLSGQIFVLGGDHLQRVELVQGLAGASFTAPFFYLVPQMIAHPNTADFYGFNHETRISFEQGQTVRLMVSKNIFTNSAGFANLFYSGHFITL